MNRKVIWWLCALVLTALVAPVSAADSSNVPPVFVLRIAGAIGPATAEHVARSIELAAREHAQLVVLQIDTSGRLYTSRTGTAGVTKRWRRG